MGILDKKFGFLYFIDEKKPKNGYYSIAGQKIEKFNIIDDIPKNVIFLTNISFQTFFTANIWRNSNLRHDGYLILKPKDILLEWNYVTDKSLTPQNIQILGLCFHKIMSIVSNLFYKINKDDNPDEIERDIFTHNSLREDMVVFYGQYLDFPYGKAKKTLKSGQAWQDFTNTGFFKEKEEKSMMLRKSRWHYSLEMLNSSLPFGKMKEYSHVELMNRFYENDEEIKSFFNDMKSPFIVEADIHKMNTESSILYGYNNSTDVKKRSIRSWITQPEYIFLSTITDPLIKSAFVFDHYDKIINKFHIEVRNFLLSKFNQLSWSCGIVAETLWRVMLLGDNKKGEEKAESSIQGVFLRATDKISMFLDAAEFQKKGIKILSYGNGWINIGYMFEEKNRIILETFKNGFLPKMSDIEDYFANPLSPVDWGGEKDLSLFVRLFSEKNNNLLWKMDGVFFNGQKGALIKSIVEEYKKNS